jgi:hypothetical protein
MWQFELLNPPLKSLTVISLVREENLGNVWLEAK